MRVIAIICGRGNIIRTDLTNITEVLVEMGWVVDVDTAMQHIADKLDTTYSGTKLAGPFESYAVQSALEAAWLEHK